MYAFGKVICTMNLIGDNDVCIKSNLLTPITLYQLNQKVSTYG